MTSSMQSSHAAHPGEVWSEVHKSPVRSQSYAVLLFQIYANFYRNFQENKQNYFHCGIRIFPLSYSVGNRSVHVYLPVGKSPDIPTSFRLFRYCLPQERSQISILLNLCWNRARPVRSACYPCFRQSDNRCPLPSRFSGHGNQSGCSFPAASPRSQPGCFHTLHNPCHPRMRCTGSVVPLPCRPAV